MMVLFVHQLLKVALKHVIQWAAVAKQTLAVEVGVAGVVALRAAVVEHTREQEHVLKSLHTMALHARHIKIQTLEVVIQWAAVARQQQVVDHTEAVVKNAEAELRKELVQKNHLIMVLRVPHILIQQAVIQWVAVVVKVAVVVINV
jgi:hypothetical protein